jgi:hypothetical protein
MILPVFTVQVAGIAGTGHCIPPHTIFIFKQVNVMQKSSRCIYIISYIVRYATQISLQGLQCSWFSLSMGFASMIPLTVHGKYSGENLASVLNMFLLLLFPKQYGIMMVYMIFTLYEVAYITQR